MACPECQMERSHGGGWCKYCGEDLYRSKRRTRILYYFIISIVLVTLGYFFLDVAIPLPL